MSYNITPTGSILIAGVGGQGTLLAARILGSAFLAAGCDVKVSEVHGMSQRGGSVVTYVKYGESVASPVICLGEADIILSFEALEAARYLPELKKGGVIVTGTQRINPMPVITGAAEYPTDIIEKIREKGVKVVALDAQSAARDAGSEKAANVVLIGAAVKYLGLDDALVEEAVKSSVPPKTVELNLKAYTAGKNIA